MSISTAVFGVYFKLSSQQHSNSSAPELSLLLTGQGQLCQDPQADLAWLALTSMGLFITGELNTYICILGYLTTAFIQSNISTVYIESKATHSSNTSSMAQSQGTVCIYQAQYKVCLV